MTNIFRHCPTLFVRLYDSNGRSTVVLEKRQKLWMLRLYKRGIENTIKAYLLRFQPEASMDHHDVLFCLWRSKQHSPEIGTVDIGILDRTVTISWSLNENGMKEISSTLPVVLSQHHHSTVPQLDKRVVGYVTASSTLHDSVLGICLVDSIPTNGNEKPMQNCAP